ncbi:serine hydrolase domain-containing protein [Pseudoalteromonas sp. GB56]
MTPRTKFVIRISLLISTVISLFFVPWILVFTWLAPLPESLDQELESAVERGADGIVVYVDSPLATTHFFTAGYSDRDLQTRASENLLFKIASIEKLYVATAIAQLAAQERLDINAPLTQFFPDFKHRIEFSDLITIRMLVQHRSGLPNYTDTPGYWETPMHEPAKKLSLILDRPARFKPDSSYEYSNSNYFFLKKVIEQVSQLSFDQYLRLNILNPLGLTHTFTSLNDVELSTVMSGYYVGYEQDIKSNNYGSMLASVKDVAIFVRALSTGQLLNAKAQNIYITLYEFEHGGLLPGYQSYVKYHQDIDAVIVQSINTTDLAGYDWNLSQITYSRVTKIVKKQISQQ